MIRNGSVVFKKESCSSSLKDEQREAALHLRSKDVVAVLPKYDISTPSNDKRNANVGMMKQIEEML